MLFYSFFLFGNITGFTFVGAYPFKCIHRRSPPGTDHPFVLWLCLQHKTEILTLFMCASLALSSKTRSFHLSVKKNRLRLGLVYATDSKGLAKHKTATTQEIVFFLDKRNRNRDHNMWAMKVREPKERKG